MLGFFGYIRFTYLVSKKRMIKNLRNVLLIYLLCSNYIISAQSLTKRDVEKLNSLEINIREVNFNKVSIQKELNRILSLEKKRRANKTIASIATGMSISGLLIGGIITSQKKDIVEGKLIYSEPVGRFMMKAGAVWGGLSIPFWILTSKRKKQRDKLIKLF